MTRPDYPAKFYEALTELINLRAAHAALFNDYAEVCDQLATLEAEVAELRQNTKV